MLSVFSCFSYVSFSACRSHVLFPHLSKVVRPSTLVAPLLTYIFLLLQCFRCLGRSAVGPIGSFGSLSGFPDDGRSVGCSHCQQILQHLHISKDLTHCCITTQGDILLALLMISKISRPGSWLAKASDGRFFSVVVRTSAARYAEPDSLLISLISA